MALHATKIAGLQTSGTANTFLSLVGIKAGATTGQRFRLKKLVIGGGGGAAQDLQISLRIARATSASSAGTSTSVNVNTIGKIDANSAASHVAAMGKNYSAEPDTIETGYLAGGAFNTRGTLILEWGTDGPVFQTSETCLIQAAPGASTTANLEAFVMWEEF